MTVLICVPTYETIATECYKALWELDDCGHALMFDAVKGYDCAKARVKCCERALEFGVEWLLMVDSDTVLPHDALSNMIQHDADVCLGYYQWKIKKEPGETCLWKAGGWCERFSATELHALEDRGITYVKSYGGGMGCALIRTAILEKLPRPWFRWVVRPDGTETGEDIYFFDQCHAMGFNVVADTRVACGHVYSENHEI